MVQASQILENTSLVDPALGRLLESKPIASSKSLTNLLTYLVREESEGRGERLTPYSVAVDALSFPETFDPSLDSRLRVEMKRLREAIDFYYRTDGRNDPLHITFPQRSYRPVFIERLPEPRAINWPRLKRDGLTIVISLFIGAMIMGWGSRERVLVTSVNAVEQNHAPRARPELIQIFIDPDPDSDVSHAITGDLAVAIGYFSRSDVRLRSRLDDNVRSAYPEEYRLTISPERTASLEDPGRQVTFKVTHLKSGDFIAAPSVSAIELFGSAEKRRAAILEVSASLMELRGAILTDYFRRGDLTPTMDCMAKADVYRSHQSDEAHFEAVRCIEDLIHNGTENAELYSALASLFGEEATDIRNPRPGDPLERALKSVNQSIKLDLQMPEAYMIASTIHAMLGNHEALKRAGETSLARNPFDSRVAGAIGYMLVITGEYDDGMAYLQRSLDLSPIPRPWRTYALFLAHLAAEDLDSATSYGLLLAGSDDPLSIAAYIVASHQAGLHD